MLQENNRINDGKNSSLIPKFCQLKQKLLTKKWHHSSLKCLSVNFLMAKRNMTIDSYW